MPIERHPKKLAPRIPPQPNESYRPGTNPNRLEDWKTVAADFNVNVEYLLYYNFQTNDPDVVNWYLRNYVGCKKSRDGLNWAFSADMNPGLIYIPTAVFDFTEIVKPRVGGRNQLARFIDGMQEDFEGSDSENWERIHFVLDLVEAIHIAIGVTEAELGIAGLGLEIAGPFMTLAGTFLSLGGAVLGAVDHKKQEQMLRGFGYGVVLGANGADGQWIRSSWFMHQDDSWFHDVLYPEYEKQYKSSYYSGLVHGIAYGRLLNGHEAAVLMKMLASKARRDDEDYLKYWNRRGGELPLFAFVKWKNEDFASKHDALGNSQKIDYYTDCATKFRKDFLPPLG